MAIAFGLVLLGASCVAIAQYLIFSQPRETPDKSFGDNLVPAILMLSAVASWIAGGVVAAVALRRDRLQSSTGRWAIRVLIFDCALLPLFGVIDGFFQLIGNPLPEGWGEPIVPFWFGGALLALVLALWAKQERLRGLLIIPLYLGAATSTFMLGELITSH